MPSSTIFGSTMMSRTSAGEDLYSSEIKIELMHTDLPEPVVPAMSKCGIFAKSMTCAVPVMSLPSATDKLAREFSKFFEPMTSRSDTICTVRFGTSMPTASLSGIGAMRTVSAPNDRAISSDSEVMRENLTPRSI